MRILFALILISGFLTAYCANIIEDCTGYKMEHTNPGYETKIVTRSVTRYDDNSTSTLNFNYHFFKYGDATAAPMPIVWIFIEWGGTVSQSEGRMRYETAGSDPFIAVVVKEGDGNDGTVQTGNWYWGNEYQGKSVPWAHLEVVDFITEIKTGETAIPFAGAVPDTNRFYAYGHSIGGTATDQIGIKHPELFAAFHGHAGWTRYWGPTNNFYTSGTFCRVFAGMIGGISGGSKVMKISPTCRWGRTFRHTSILILTGTSTKPETHGTIAIPGFPLHSHFLPMVMPTTRRTRVITCSPHLNRPEEATSTIVHRAVTRAAEPFSGGAG
jgi:hypothetical protein